MSWNNQFPQDKEPSWQDVLSTVGSRSGLWETLTEYIQDTYNVLPTMQYSSCSAQPGWNVKYQKKGKAICTLYPEQDHFIVLVVVGSKHEKAVRSLIEQGSCSEYVRDLYYSAKPMAIGRWLMIEVEGSAILEDIKQIIAIRMGL